MANENMRIYMFYDDKGNPMISLVEIIEKYTIGARVKVHQCYCDTPFGLYKYLAGHNGEANASLKFLHDITKHINNCDHMAICELLNELIGCDGMYYGIDTYGIAVDICRYCYER